MLQNQKILTFATLATVALLGCITPVHAAPITYTLSTTASGTLGGTSFTDALVTVTLTADTENVVPGPTPFTGAVANYGTAVVNVAGIGTGSFTGPVGIFSSLNDPASLAFFGGTPGVIMIDNTTDTGIIAELGSAFGTYDLRSSLGPLTGPGGPASGSHTTPVFSTTVGDFTWAIGQTGGTLPSTFTASATPEPGTFGILAAGLVAVVWRRRLSKAT